MIKRLILVLLIIIFNVSLIYSDNVTISDSSGSEESSSMLKVFFVTPFKSKDTLTESDIVHFHSDFMKKLRSFEVNDNYGIYQTEIRDIIKNSGMCTNYITSNLSVANVLKNCFNYKPAEAAALINIISSYLRWRDTEIRTVLSSFIAKLSSSKFKDRLEAKLFFSCINKGYSNESNYGTPNYNEIDQTASKIVSYCSDPSNWDFSYLWPELKDCAVNEKNMAVFSFRDFVSNCLANKFLANYESDTSYGVRALIGLLLDERIVISSNGIDIYYYPFSANTKFIYETIRLRALSILNSQWYNELVTGGCIPSVFAPAGEKLVTDKIYYSVCVPTGLIKQINALPESDSKFFRELLANKIAVLQTLELLHALELVSLEAERLLKLVDSDLANFARLNYLFSKSLAKAYKDSIDIAYSTTIEDILDSVTELYSNYMKEKEVINNAAREYAAEIIDRQIQVKEGSSK